MFKDNDYIEGHKSEVKGLRNNIVFNVFVMFLSQYILDIA